MENNENNENNQDNQDKKSKKEIEIINGDGSNLNISNVSEHLNATTPKSHDNAPKNIIVPKEVHNNENKSNNNDTTTKQ